MDFILGIDVGTTGTKSGLFTAEGELADLEYQAYPLTYPEQGWAEQAPQDWWTALKDTTRAVVKRNRAGRNVRAMALSTQGGCLVLLDRSFEPVQPAVSWMDKRASETADLLVREIRPDELYRSCGWPVMDSLGFPTIFWFRQRNPGLLKRVKYYASTIDYLNYLLTGRLAIDYTNCALTGFLELRSRGFSEKAMRIAGLNADSLPELVPSGASIGRIDAAIARDMGLSEDVIVVSGAHDRYCESIGAGAIQPGDCVLGAGTSWVLLAASHRPIFHSSAPGDRGYARTVFPGLHPIEGRFGLMTVIPHGGNSLRWFRDVMRPGSSFQQMNADASTIDAGSEGLFFIPISSSGSGRGSFQNIDAMHTVKHFTRAVFEGVALVNRIHYDSFGKAGRPIGKLIMIGGGAKSELWPQMVADVCNVTVELPLRQEAACAGAAVLAASGCGLFPSIEEGSRHFTGRSTRLRPSAQSVKAYEERFRVFLDFLDRV